MSLIHLQLLLNMEPQLKKEEWQADNLLSTAISLPERTIPDSSQDILHFDQSPADLNSHIQEVEEDNQNQGLLEQDYEQRFHNNMNDERILEIYTPNSETLQPYEHLQESLRQVIEKSIENCQQISQQPELKNFYQFLKTNLIKILKRSLPHKKWLEYKRLQRHNFQKKSRSDCENLLNYNNDFKKIFLRTLQQKQLHHRIMLSSLEPRLKQTYLLNLRRLKIQTHRNKICLRLLRKKRSDAKFPSN